MKNVLFVGLAASAALVLSSVSFANAAPEATKTVTVNPTFQAGEAGGAGAAGSTAGATAITQSALLSTFGITAAVGATVLVGTAVYIVSEDDDSNTTATGTNN